MEAQKEWFADWFDTHYYHILYKNRDDHEAKMFIENLCSILKLQPNSSLLDLACGKGRHSITLNSLGHKVLGVDLSENSIQFAKKFEQRGLHFEVHDMRKIIPGLSFDAIFNLFTSFGYFDSTFDNKRVIQAVGNMLYDKGLFIIDFMNAEKVITNLVSNEEKEIDGVHFSIERMVEGEHIYKKITINDQGETKKYIERVQALTLSNFTELLQPEFKIIHTFGDFSLRDFNPIESDRLIIIAEKNA
jgi:cyclopropane fatty-acyl-phospholipid synthase-like methyltransferase